MNWNDRTEKLRVLRLDMELGWESAPYNQFSLPLTREHDITFSTYLPAPIRVPPDVRLYEGDGTLAGYVLCLGHALRGRGFDIVHAHTPHVGTAYLNARALMRAPRPPTVFTMHNCYTSYKRRNRLLLLPVFAGFDRIVCCSHASRESFPALYRRIAGDRLTVIQNGVDLARIDRAIEGVRRSDGTFRILSVGRLIPIKSPALAARAFAAVARRNGAGGDRLIYIGKGPLRDDVSETARALGIADRVSFAGRIPRDEVFRRAAAADVFISTSRGEGLPVAVLEAMACGCPVILSDIAPHREIASGVREIPLVDPDDLEGFASELRRFREMSPERRTAIGRRCREVVEDRFGLERMLGEYRALYTDLTGREVAPAYAREEGAPEPVGARRS